MFCVKIVKKNNINILKEIVWETQKWHYNFSRTHGSRVIDKNNIFHVLINNLRTAWPTKISMLFLSFTDNLHEDNHIIFH